MSFHLTLSATFVKLSIDHVSALVSSGNSGIALELPKGVFIDTSSMASKSCRSVMGLGVPTISVHILHRKSEEKRWQPIGSVATGLSLDNYKLPHDWKTVAEEQMKFLKEQDSLTRRVPYLYGEHDDPSYGRYNHGVYIPRPREVLIPWAETTTTTSVEEPVFEESSDSATESDSSSPDVPISRVPRRKRGLSIAAMQEQLERQDCDSLGDESDSVSSAPTASSSSSLDDHRPLGTGADMAVILEDRLRSFKKIYQRGRRLFSHPSNPQPPPADEDSPTPFVPLTISDGAIFQIQLAKTTVELNTDTLHSAVDVSGALSACVGPSLVESITHNIRKSHQRSSSTNCLPIKSAPSCKIAMLGLQNCMTLRFRYWTCVSCKGASTSRSR